MNRGTTLGADGFSLDATTWSQLGAWGHYDPRGDLEQLTTPTLAIFGSNDRLVPVPASLAHLRDTADQAARPQQITVFAGADHRLQASAGLAPGYLSCLTAWCREPPPQP